MSAISDYTDRVNAQYQSIGDDVDGLVASLGGVTKDVTDLKDIITKLQNNPGPISPEDQALLDRGETVVGALVTKVKAAADALKALDASTETPPPAPVV